MIQFKFTIYDYILPQPFKIMNDDYNIALQLIFTVSDYLTVSCKRPYKAVV